MTIRPVLFFAFLSLISCVPHAGAQSKAKYLRITIPRSSILTPVQRLNREGVAALLKQNYEAAERSFNKAYLYDPTDPFTLNNLGYVSELEGEFDRAQKFYKLAVEQGCYAIIDRSSLKELKGKPMISALGTGDGTTMRVNSMNVLAMELLSEGRSFEAQSVLQKALALDPHNAFTLNNLGATEEALGDLVSALEFYERASTSNSAERIVVSEDRSSRGKPVSLMASESAQSLRARMQGMDPDQIRAMMLSIRGVSAANHNDWDTARKDFLEAYSLQPQSAFTLNNYGYVAERDGDLETAGSYYALAEKARDSGARVGMATDAVAQGRRLDSVAATNREDVDAEQEAAREIRRTREGPVKLIPRGSQPATPEQPNTLPPAKSETASPTPSPQPLPQ
jgi:Flp pilus assembly protein TadD